MLDTGIWAKSILASEHTVTSARLDTILCRLPKSLLAELNTHRAFSRNAASSRAIPIARIIEQVENDPFIPVKWTKNEPGMQGYEELAGWALQEAQDTWDKARRSAIQFAKTMAATGCHKQIVNRILEPWMWAIVCISATEWANFFKLRNHSAAEPHMQILAQAIWNARESATTQQLEPGDWHRPFLDEFADEMLTPDMKNVLSVARCASTSYKTVDGTYMVLVRAEKIYNSLLSDPLHASPFEHVAQADDVQGTGIYKGEYFEPEQHRNFVGFRQLRAMVETRHGV